MKEINKVKALLVDDEEYALDGLEAQLKAFCSRVEVTGKATNVRLALERIQKQKPDLIFLDVEMPGANGFELLHSIPETLMPVVIFTTAFEKHALKAIKNSAADYLLKPVDADELCSAVAKAIKMVELKKKQEGSAGEKFKVQLSDQSGVVFVLPEEIIHIEGDGRYSTVHLVKRAPMVMVKNLMEFEENLTSRGFFRVHKSHLVNCSHIMRIINRDGGFAELSNGKQIEISRRRKAEFLEFLKKSSR